MFYDIIGIEGIGNYYYCCYTVELELKVLEIITNAVQ